MSDIIEKLKKSGLFPDNIRDFLMTSIENGDLNDLAKNELDKMLEEEADEISRIRNA